MIRFCRGVEGHRAGGTVEVGSTCGDLGRAVGNAKVMG